MTVADGGRRRVARLVPDLYRRPRRAECRPLRPELTGSDLIDHAASRPDAHKLRVRAADAPRHLVRDGPFTAAGGSGYRSGYAAACLHLSRFLVLAALLVGLAGARVALARVSDAEGALAALARRGRFPGRRKQM